MRYYYYYESWHGHLDRAWQTGCGHSMVESGGHHVVGDNVVLATEQLALRHYIVRDQAHAYEKYAGRVFLDHELETLKWHGDRANQAADAFALPPLAQLKQLDTPDSRSFDTTSPQQSHYWQWD